MPLVLSARRWHGCGATRPTARRGIGGKLRMRAPARALVLIIVRPCMLAENQERQSGRKGTCLAEQRQKFLAGYTFEAAKKANPTTHTPVSNRRFRKGRPNRVPCRLGQHVADAGERRPSPHSEVQRSAGCGQLRSWYVVWCAGRWFLAAIAVQARTARPWRVF